MNGSEKNDVGFVPASGYFCLHLRNGEVLDREPIVASSRCASAIDKVKGGSRASTL